MHNEMNIIAQHFIFMYIIAIQFIHHLHKDVHKGLFLLLIDIDHWAIVNSPQQRFPQALISFMNEILSE
ncbi:hypothetical protein D3C85_1555130 [compost metagenome]